jgi:hypothetical protein
MAGDLHANQVFYQENTYTYSGTFWYIDYTLCDKQNTPRRSCTGDDASGHQT